MVNGQRFRQSLDTTDWREAQSKEKELIVQASAGKLAPTSQQFSKLNFTRAIERYLEDRAAHVQPRSKRSESDHAKPIKEYFASLPIARIDADSILAYIRHRKANGLSNTTVNMEIGILRRILKRAKRWHFVEDEIPRLPERRDIGRALRPEEKLHFLKLAQSKPEWDTAYLASVIALNTTMRGCEIKQLRWSDVDLMDQSLVIRRSKTLAGERMIPLNADAYTAIMRLRERAQKEFGPELQADWYVFPSAEGYSKPDPRNPMSGWRSAWRSFTRAVTCPACGELQNPAKPAATKNVRRTSRRSKAPQLDCVSTISGTMPLQNWLSPKRAIGPLCRLQVTSPRECWLTTRTSELKRRGRHLMRWRGPNQTVTSQNEWKEPFLNRK